MTNKEEYFADTTAISNSQLRTFVQYNKYGKRDTYPDDYIAMHIDKVIEFEMNDAMIVGKIVDEYFDGTGPAVWEKYIPAARRTGKDIPEGCMEITMGMKDEAEKMIKRGIAFRSFKSFLKHPNTKSQVQLKKDLEITDAISGEVRTVAVKGLPDYVNDDLKLIVDLKTTGSRQMIIDDLQFRGEPNLTANYIRQLSIYNQLLGGTYSGALALVTADGVKWIDIPNQILLDAWKIIERDIIELDNFLKDPTTLNESIFQKNEEIVALEDLGL